MTCLFLNSRSVLPPVWAEFQQLKRGWEWRRGGGVVLLLRLQGLTDLALLQEAWAAVWECEGPPGGTADSQMWWFVL